MKLAILLSAAALLCAPACLLAQSQCGVNWSDVRQRIDGFGASSAWRGTWSTAQADMFFSTNTGAGLSLLRNHISYAFNTNATTSLSTAEISIMQMAQARGALVWSAPWTPAAGFKSGGAVNGGNFLGGSNNVANVAYASQLANYVALMSNSYGVNIYALSVQNEPDFNTTGYESCVWNGSQFHDFVTNLSAALINKGFGSTKIIIPESEHWSSDTALYTPTLNDPNTAAVVSIIADHNYDNCPPSGTPAALAPPGKSLWETEVSKLSCAGAYDASITDGLYWAGRIHLFLTSAQANAWHYWWLISANSDNEGLTDVNGNPAKRMYVLGQWSRFVRPGYRRIGVSNVNTSLLISAFNDTNSGMVSIVAVNNSASDIVETFNLFSFTINGSVTPWITSSNLSLASQTPVSVGGASFTYTLPAQSVVTFVGQGSPNSAPTDISLSNSTVPEGQPSGTPVGNFSTTDPNAGDTFTYSLVSGTGSDDNASFSISGASLQTAATFDYQTQNTFTIRVRSTDQGGLFVEKVFTVTVLSVPTDITLSNTSVQETQPVGTLVGNLGTVDANGADTFSYTLVSGTGSDDNASFTISGNALQTAAVFSYEAQNSFSVRVRSTTQDNQWVEQSFVIGITDVNVPPNTPTNLSPAAGSVVPALGLTLQASPFSDPNPGDTQAASEWLIQRTTDNSVVFDSGTDLSDLSILAVPGSLLDYLTPYAWQVRYEDNHGAWSDYSASAAFTTAAPSLNVAKQAGNIIVSWPTNAVGFALQYSIDLSSTNWNPVSPGPVVIGDQNVVTNATTGPAIFFRLYVP